MQPIVIKINFHDIHHGDFAWAVRSAITILQLAVQVFLSKQSSLIWSDNKDLIPT